MASALAPKPLGRTEAAYAIARVTISASLVVLFSAGMLDNPPALDAARAWGLGLLAFTSVAVLVAFIVFGLPTRLVLLTALPFDLVASGLVLVATHDTHDPVYTWLVALVVIYAVALPRREADATAFLVAVTYLGAHYAAFGPSHGLGDYLVLAYKAIFIVLMSFFVSEGVYRQNRREAELAANHRDIENLNEQLQRRLGELNAVSEITEVIHSSLDFDTVGPLVLEIIQKVIDLPSCSMLVLDKEKAETLFAASAGLKGSTDRFSELAALQSDTDVLQVDGGLYSCTTLIDHGRMMVVLCALQEQIEHMPAEDRLVLQAVASELAVAVENSQLYKLTRRLAITDELTGLFNYRHMQQRLDDEFERSRRFERPLSLLMLDTDDFKLFNDSYGHMAGDRALAELGGLVKKCVREIDVPARYGGEEFTVILPETDAAGAFVVAEKIREAVAEHLFCDEDGDRCARLTLSIGLAAYPMHAEDRESLLRQADDALYTAKSLGRDRVRAAVPVMHAIVGELSVPDAAEWPA